MEISTTCFDIFSRQVDLSSEEGRCQAEHLYQELLSKIQAMEDKMQAASNFDLERTMDFSQARDTLRVITITTTSKIINIVEYALVEMSKLMCYDCFCSDFGIQTLGIPVD